MAPKDSPTDAPENAGPKLTDNDIRVLQLAWQCFETMPKVNTAKLAELGGWKTPASANTAFHNAKKRLLGDIKLPPAEKTPKKGAVKKEEVEGEGEDNDDEEAKVDVPKKTKTPRKRKAAAVTEDGNAEDGDEATAVKETPQKKKKRAPRKKKVDEKVEEDAVSEEKHTASSVEDAEMVMKAENDDGEDV